MSADRWSVCPKCSQQKDDNVKRFHEEVMNNYGKLPVEQWLALRTEAERTESQPIPETFREDYYIQSPIYGASSVYVSYEGKCSACGFAIDFTYNHDFEVTQ